MTPIHAAGYAVVRLLTMGVDSARASIHDGNLRFDLELKGAGCTAFARLVIDGAALMIAQDVHATELLELECERAFEALACRAAMPLHAQCLARGEFCEQHPGRVIIAIDRRARTVTCNRSGSDAVVHPWPDGAYYARRGGPVIA